MSREGTDWIQWGKKAMVLGLVWLLPFPGLAQEGADLGEGSRRFYREAYERQPSNRDNYTIYLDYLINQEDWKAAQQLVEAQRRIWPQNPVLLIDLGLIYQKRGKEKQAESYFEEAIQGLNGDDLLTQQMAQAFGKMGRTAAQLRVYERAQDILKNPYLYSGPLARLYAATNQMDKAIDALLHTGVGRQGGMEDIQSALSEFIGEDRNKLQQSQRAIVRKINEQPDNPYFTELLTWIYTRKGDWEGALIQVEALDRRLQSRGRRIMGFAQRAVKEQAYEVALLAYERVMEADPGGPLMAQAGAEALGLRYKKIQDSRSRDTARIFALSRDYAAFLEQWPQYRNRELVLDYANLEALYARRLPQAISLLEGVLAQPGLPRAWMGPMKLRLGDFYVMDGRVWDASLTYSQVDKAFREDLIGEEARFRNARLAYFRGDFDWAQGQLSVLKGSTSELIANDAMALSILIMENQTPDSNDLPLQRFARADLMLFQRSHAEALRILDSLQDAFPDHPLKDDILWKKADIAWKEGQMDSAYAFLQEIVEEHGQDVLGDDALFRQAEIQDYGYEQKEKARALYLQVILQYPGSLHVQQARRRIEVLDSPSSS